MSGAGTKVTSIGSVTIAERNGKIVSLTVGTGYYSPVDGVVAAAFDQLEEYLDGKRETFDLDFVLKGTDFQMDVWSALMKVPYGETVSYSELASLSGHPGASRAVGNAVGRNPIPVFVPCHRAIRNDGRIGGYSLGTDIKGKLLKIEGIL